MSKVPYIPLYIGDWEQDTNCLSLSAEAAWLKIIFKMFKDNKSGIYKTSTKSLQNLWKTDTNGIQNILSELLENNICGIEIGEQIIFSNRRMLREREISAIRTKSVQNRYKPSTKQVQSADIDNEYDNVNESYLIPRMLAIFKSKNTCYFIDKQKDLSALGTIAKNLAKLLKKIYDPADESFIKGIISEWEKMIDFILADDFFCNYDLQQISKYFQNINQTRTNGRSKINRGLAADASRPGTVREPM